tara:strand:- start:598 stop:1158 length:561 start_codon:yes stop_codon:yes gene_type:complete
MKELTANESIIELVDTLMQKNKDTQMTREEYLHIASLIPNTNFLVFGTGNDTVLWKEANKEGTTLFLENDIRWIDKSDEDIFTVQYTCTRSQAEYLLQEYKEGRDEGLRMEYPKELDNIVWDYVLVDSPWDGSHGRMQSIYLASKLATQAHTQIFLHDCNRWVEDVYGTLFFGNNFNQFEKLRHYV